MVIKLIFQNTLGIPNGYLISQSCDMLRLASAKSPVYLFFLKYSNLVSTLICTLLYFYCGSNLEISVLLYCSISTIHHQHPA